MLLPDLHQRLYVPELMDAASCDETKLLRSYRQLALINKTISRMHALLERHVLEELEPARPMVHIVEVGCGGGDVLAWLAARCRRRNLNVQLTGTDTDERALGLARARVARYSEVKLCALPLQELGQLDPAPDYVFSNHVLHHIPPDDVVTALAHMRQATRRKLLVNDLQRSRFSYVAYSILAGALFHRSFTFHDGRLSIRKGFLRGELEHLTRLAGFPDSTQVLQLFPGRVCVVAPGVAA